MSDLLDVLKPTSRKQNKVLAAYLACTEEEKDALRDAFSNSLYSGADIANAFKAKGFEIASSQVSHFRKRLREGSIKL